MRFDVAIIGAGVAGNSLANIIAKKGYKTVVIEKNKEIGNKLCGGLVSKRVLNLSKTDAVVNEIKGAYVIFPNGKEICIGGNKTNAYVIDRKIFDRELAEKAMSNGAEYKLNFKVKHIFKNKINGEIEFEWLIGADGARSFVAKKFCMGEVSFINAIQGNAKMKIDEDFVKIYINQEIAPGFFAWLIPDGNKVRIGLGSHKKALRKKLNKFIKIIDANIFDIKASLIPIGLRKFYLKNVILVGDACGHVKATSGGGIYGSLLASKLLGENFENFENYRKKFMGKFGKELRKCILVRKIFLKLNNRDFNEMYENIKNEVELINKYGDIDYPSILAKKMVKKFIIKNPKLILKLVRCLL